jgi:hypothetical protein
VDRISTDDGSYFQRRMSPSKCVLKPNQQVPKGPLGDPDAGSVQRLVLTILDRDCRESTPGPAILCLQRAELCGEIRHPVAPMVRRWRRQGHCRADALSVFGTTAHTHVGRVQVDDRVDIVPVLSDARIP